MPSSRDVSQLLDAVSQIPGSIFVRGPKQWTGILPGPVGHTLSVNGQGFPAWSAPPASGAGGRYIMNGPITSNTTTGLFATFGNLITPAKKLTTTGMQVCWGPLDLNYRLRVEVWRTSSNTFAEKIATSAVLTPTFTGNQSHYVRFINPGTLMPDVEYAVIGTRTEATATSNAYLMHFATQIMGFPLRPHLPQYLTAPTTQAIAGASFTRNASNANIALFLEASDAA